MLYVFTVGKISYAEAMKKVNVETGIVRKETDRAGIEVKDQ